MGECTMTANIVRKVLSANIVTKVFSHSNNNYSNIRTPTSMASTNKKNISYLIVRPHQLPEVHKLMYQSFHRDEPMTKHLGLCKGSFSIPDSDEMVEGLVLDHNLSIMAMDRETDTPLAACLGYKGCKTEATGAYSRKAFTKAGFEVVAEVKYKQCQLEGKEVFSGIEGHEGVAFQAKMLT